MDDTQRIGGASSAGEDLEEVSTTKPGDDEYGTNSIGDQTDCPEKTDRNTVSTETKSCLQEANDSAPLIESTSMEVQESAASCLDEDIVLGIEERIKTVKERKDSPSLIESESQVLFTDKDVTIEMVEGTKTASSLTTEGEVDNTVERAELQCEYNQVMTSIDRQQCSDLQRQDDTSIDGTQNMAPMEADDLSAGSLPVGKYTQEAISSMEIANMEADTTEVIRIHSLPVEKEDGTETKLASVPLQLGQLSGEGINADVTETKVATVPLQLVEPKDKMGKQDGTTFTHSIAPNKADVSSESSCPTKENTHVQETKMTTETDSMETDAMEVIRIHSYPVEKKDVEGTKVASVHLEQVQPSVAVGEGGSGSHEDNVSTDSESSSEEESESSSESSDVEEQAAPTEKPKQNQPPPADEDVGTQVSDEVPEELFPDVVLPDDVQVKAVGRISCIIGQLVVVESYPSTPALDAETLLFNNNKRSIGLVHDTFGPVIKPCYTIQFSSAKKIEAASLSLQSEIFYAPEVEDFTVYVFTQKLIIQKGSDASWKNDQEPPPEFLDYSDDEQERNAKKSIKEAKGKKPKQRKAFKREPDGPRADSGHQQGPGPGGRRGGWHGHHGNQEQWYRRPEHDYDIPRYPPPFDPPPFQGPPPGPPPPFRPPPFAWNHHPPHMGGMNVRPPNYGPPPGDHMPHGHHMNHPPRNVGLPFPPPPPPPPMRDGQMQGGGGRPLFPPPHYSGPPAQGMFHPMQFPFPPPPPPPPPPPNS